MLFSDLWPVYITLIGKLMLRKVLISLWHQFIGHDMTCEVCDSKHLCSFHFIFSALLIYFDFSRSWFGFKTPICLQGVNSTSPITRAHLCFVPILIFMQLKNWFSPRSNHPLVQEKHLANSCVFSCGEQGGPIGRRLGGKDCKEAANVCQISPKTKFSVFLYKSWNWPAKDKRQIQQFKKTNWEKSGKVKFFQHARACICTVISKCVMVLIGLDWKWEK